MKEEKIKYLSKIQSYALMAAKKKSLLAQQEINELLGEVAKEHGISKDENWELSFDCTKFTKKKETPETDSGKQ